MKRSGISILLLISLISQTSQGSEDQCRKDCKVVISAAQKAIHAKDDVINAQGKTITDLQSILADTRLDLNNKTLALDSWYHNPVILILGGIILGKVVTTYLLPK